MPRLEIYKPPTVSKPSNLNQQVAVYSIIYHRPLESTLGGVRCRVNYIRWRGLGLVC